MLSVCGEESSMVCEDGFGCWFGIWKFWVELVLHHEIVNRGRCQLINSLYVVQSNVFLFLVLINLLVLVVIDSWFVEKTPYLWCFLGWRFLVLVLILEVLIRVGASLLFWSWLFCVGFDFGSSSSLVASASSTWEDCNRSRRFVWWNFN